MAAFLMEHSGQLLAMAVLLVLSGFFSASETALFSLSRERLRRFRQSGNRFERLAAWLMNQPNSLLVTVLLGNNLVNVAFFALSCGVTLDLGADYNKAWAGAVGVATLAAVVFFGDMVPKTLAASTPEHFAKLAALPLYLLFVLLTPLRYALDNWLVEPFFRLFTGRSQLAARQLYLTADELQAIVEIASDEGIVGRDEGEMMSEVFSLHTARVREVMVPRVDMIACEVATPPAEMLARFTQSKLKRMVVYEETPDEVLGVISAIDAFLHPEKSPAALLRPVLFVPEQQTVDRLLKTFRDQREHLAVVVDEYGGTAGLVTLEDCLEEIVGDIQDDYGHLEQPVVRLSDREFLLAGNLSMRAWRDYLGQALDTEMGVTTLAGFVAGVLGHIPKEGESCQYGNIRFTVKKLVCRPNGVCGRASQILVEILEPPGEGESQAAGNSAAARSDGPPAAPAAETSATPGTAAASAAGSPADESGPDQPAEPSQDHTVGGHHRSRPGRGGRRRGGDRHVE